MSNRLAIDPSEIRIPPYAEIRRRLWSIPPVAIPRPAPAPVVKPSINGMHAVEKYRLFYSRTILSETPKKVFTVFTIRRKVEDILLSIAMAHDYSVAQLKGRRREKPLIRARQEAYYTLCVERPDLSYPDIARKMGGRDHTTVIYGARHHAEINGLPPVVRS